MALKVTDSTGLTLLNQDWQNHAPAAMRGPDVFAVEMLSFRVAPGRYRLHVSIRDSVSGREKNSELEIEGFDSAPPASDLLLSPAMRPTTTDDTVPLPGQIRWGQLLVTAAAQLQLTPLRSTAYYLLEAYSPEQAAGTLKLRIVDSTGKAITTTAPSQVQVPAGGGVLKGQLALDGLPPGNYQMVAALALGKDSVERSAKFSMTPLQETLVKQVATRQAERATDEGYFKEMSEKDLAAAKAPLLLVAESGELSSYTKELSLQAKRRFLTEFWRKRDPTPETPENETRQRFYQAVAYADKTYGERGRAGVPGWKTDRGRIYVRNGAPDEILDRTRAGRSVPYEVWRIRRGKDRYYVFADRSNGLGLYQLIHSNDRKEIGLPNWQEIIRQEAVLDIGRFLGIDFFENSQ
jgi:GWxTD domain-containing protein